MTHESIGIELSTLSLDSDLSYLLIRRLITVTDDGPMDLTEFMKILLESQQQQNEWVTVAFEKMPASGGQAWQGNVSDFGRLHPVVFTGEESHLNAEQWLFRHTTY